MLTDNFQTEIIKVGVLPNQSGGMFVDIWEKIKLNLTSQYKYVFKEYLVQETDPDKMIADIKNEKYDIIIAGFVPTLKRSEQANFTTAVTLDKDVIAYIHESSFIGTLIQVFKNVFIVPLILVLVLGIIFGSILQWLEPNRFKHARVAKKYAWRRSVMTALGAFLGERGYLSENTTLTFKGALSVIILLITSTIFTIYLQSWATAKIINSTEKGDKFSHRNAYGWKPLLAHSGAASGEHFERLGATVEYKAPPNNMKTKWGEEAYFSYLIEYYIQNKDKYDGIILTRYMAEKAKDMFPEIVVADTDFYYDIITYPVSKSKPGLLQNVNAEIYKLQSSFEIEKICKGYRIPDSLALCRL